MRETLRMPSHEVGQVCPPSPVGLARNTARDVAVLLLRRRQPPRGGGLQRGPAKATTLRPLCRRPSWRMVRMRRPRIRRANRCQPPFHRQQYGHSCTPSASFFEKPCVRALLLQHSLAPTLTSSGLGKWSSRTNWSVGPVPLQPPGPCASFCRLEIFWENSSILKFFGRHSNGGASRRSTDTLG